MVASMIVRLCMPVMLAPRGAVVVAADAGEESSCTIAGQTWDERDLSVWIRGLNSHFEGYAEKVEEETIDADTFMKYDDGELEAELGIVNKNHRKRLLNAREKLHNLKVCMTDSEQKEHDLRRIFTKVAQPIVTMAKGVEFVGGEVADTLQQNLQKDKVTVDSAGMLFGENLEHLLKEFTSLAVGVLALEARSHRILQKVSGTSASALRIKKDLKKIVDAKLMVSTSFHQVRNGAASLSAGISNFRTALRIAQNPDDTKGEKELLKSEFTSWSKASIDVVTKLKDIADDLIASAKSQTEALEGSGQAVTHLHAVSDLKAQLAELVKQKNSILQKGNNGKSADMVRFAILHFSDALQPYIDENAAALEQAKAEVATLQSLLNTVGDQDKTKMMSAAKEQAGGWFSVLSPSKRDKIEDLAQDYRGQQKQSRLAIFLQEAKQVVEQEEQKRSLLAHANNDKNADEILQTSSYLHQLRQIKHTQGLVEQKEQKIMSLMKESQLTNLEALAHHLQEIQDSLALMVDVANGLTKVAEQMNGWAHNFDNLIERQNGRGHADHDFLLKVLPVVENLLSTIAKAYRAHMGQIESGNHNVLLIETYTKKVIYDQSPAQLASLSSLNKSEL